MAFRVTVLAEGGRETQGEFAQELGPGRALPEEWLGAAHLLVRRALAKQRELPVSAISFEQPLNKKNGRRARGSDLLRKKTLRGLLSYPSTRGRPDLAIVLVDEDGVADRYKNLKNFLQDLRCPHVVAVAVREFEAWLLADMAALSELEIALDDPGNLEGLKPGRAKSVLLEALSTCASETSEGEWRRSVASKASLESIRRGCPSFKRFLDDLQAVC